MCIRVCVWVDIWALGYVVGVILLLLLGVGRHWEAGNVVHGGELLWIKRIIRKGMGRVNIGGCGSYHTLWKTPPMRRGGYPNTSALSFKRSTLDARVREL